MEGENKWSEDIERKRIMSELVKKKRAEERENILAKV